MSSRKRSIVSDGGSDAASASPSAPPEETAPRPMKQLTTKGSRKLMPLVWRSKSYKNPEADLTLVSSDGWEFKVDSYYLQSASPVFRDMLERKAHSRIELSDEEIETHHVVQAFLDLATQHKIAPFELKRRGHFTHLFCNLLRFLHKYDCAGLTVHLTFYLRPLLCRTYLSTVITFKTAARTHNVELMYDIIRYYGTKKVASNDTENDDAHAALRPDETVTGSSAIDLACWDRESFDEIPTEYSFALARALAVQRMKGEDGGYDWQAAAEAFYFIVPQKEHPDVITDRVEKAAIEAQQARVST